MTERQTEIAAASPRPVRATILANVWIAMIAGGVFLSYGLLCVLSLGSGWTFPNVWPDRMNLAPWKNFFSDRDGVLKAMFLSAGLSLIAGCVATCGGLLIGRTIHRTQSTTLRFLVYLPFVLAPLIAGVCLYDLLVRLQLAGTLTGVILSQLVFTTSFASVYFSELWSPRAARMELLVRNLGGSSWSVWRHVVMPQCSGLIAVCFLQTCLYSWLDYGLVSVIGGGNVQTLTTRMFGYIREASVNQAAQSALVLLTPAIIGFVVTAALYFWRNAEAQQP